MAKARLRRGIELVKLANRIESLKMQEDPDNSDMQSDAPPEAPARAEAQLDGSANGIPTSGPSTSAKQTVQKVRGAIFREIVLAKVREMKQQEEVRKEVEGASKGSP